MVETRDAVTHLAEIASTPGLDGLFVGPNDLSLSLTGRVPDDGYSGEVADVLRAVARECASRGIVAGVYCNTAETAVTWRGAGFRLLTLESDLQYLRRGAASVLQVLDSDEN
jgi:4-hydroxy-2-oxoheptanedioate aldolase